MIENIHKNIEPNLRKYNQELLDMTAQEMLIWGHEKFDAESTTIIGKEGLIFFKFKATVIPAKPPPTITIGFCIEFIFKYCYA